MIRSRLTDLLRETARIRGEDQFVTEIASKSVLSYAKLYEMVQKQSRFMKQCGLEAQDKVGLIYKNSIEFMVDFFAVLENRAIVVPINPKLKNRELKYIIKDADLRYILTDNSEGRITESADIISNNKSGKDAYFIEINNHTAEDVRFDNLVDGTAIILYTSGSTGRAKGVMLTHVNLLNEMTNIKEAHELTGHDKVLCVLPWFHINGLVITMLTPLLAGHEIVIAEKFSRHNFWRWVDDYQITWFSGVPTIYSYLLSDIDYVQHKSLRFARSASSSLPVEVLKKFEERYQVPVIESYGMTEGGSQLTTNPVPPGIRKPGAVGLPYGLRMRIVNDMGEICREHEVGEIQFCGASISEGYYKKTEETEQTFAGGWLKTGDVGYLDEDGYLYLVGRKKELINRGGEKISPREIEEILYQYSGIKMAAAIGVPDEMYGEKVIAFCVPDPSTSLCEDEIIDFCRKYLADYKKKKKIIFYEKLPVGGNGKIQRLKLADEFKERRGSNNEKENI